MEIKERKKLPPLREQLTSHYRQKDFSVSRSSVQTSVNTAGIAMYWSMTFLLLLESLFIFIPDLYQKDPVKQLLLKVLVWLTFIVCSLNWFAIRQGVGNEVNSSTKEKYLQEYSPEVTQTGWKKCLPCQMDAPPRSHHCNHCGKCVLKRDHHCFFTGSCVGFYNQRFFVFFCLYILWGNGFAVFLQLAYLNKIVPIFSISVINYFPLVGLYNCVSGNLSLWILFLIVNLYLCTVLVGAASFFLIWHILIIWQGVTSHEAWKNVRPFGDFNVLENIRSVFGPIKWLPLTVLFPFRVEQQGDGIYWEPRRKKIKGN